MVLCLLFFHCMAYIAFFNHLFLVSNFYDTCYIFFLFDIHFIYYCALHKYAASASSTHSHKHVQNISKTKYFQSIPINQLLNSIMIGK